MSIFKCKMCGGTIEFNEGDTIGVCDSCGTKQTLPRLDSDRKTNLYDRANHFRRNNEFDKAMSIYENILNEDQSDAEAYWSIVLCRYGIEYVEDPATHKRVPTVNRAQFTSIFADEDYKQALAHADAAQRAVYEAEAHEIDDIQKGILEISAKEEPFDVFICYKETDANGRRTPDSVLATDLYHQLTNEGFKVFFSRITLEDKLGTAYEPYIFAALNSAKAMVVLGTKPEHFNAVWVKNEWSRYLALIKAGAKKTLIPAYRDMDPYDLPEEFSHLQAQDMSKLGFMQDLIRGIKKIVRTEEPKPTTIRETVVQQAAQTNTAPLLERAFMFLEDGDWVKADSFCEQVLNLEPKNAEAYLGKLMAGLHVRTCDALKDAPQPFDDRNSYQKAIRFGDEALKQKLTADNVFIRDRNETARKEGIYQEASRTMRASFTDAAKLFAQIPDYKDAAAKKEECETKAEEARKDRIYALAEKTATNAGSIQYLKEAIGHWKSISGWRDSEARITAAECRIAEIEAQQAAEKQEAARKAEEARIAAEKRKKRNKTIVLIVLAVVAFAVAAVILFFAVIQPNQRYSEAKALYEAGQYEEAVAAYEALTGYKDSAEQIIECKYAATTELMNNGQYAEALAAFIALNGYKDSTDQISKCEVAIKEERYEKAIELYNTGKYEEALSMFQTLQDYLDSASQVDTCNNAIKDREYNKAITLFSEGRLEEALALFQSVRGYRDSNDQIEKCKDSMKERDYQEAIALFNNRQYDAARIGFEELDGYKESLEYLLSIRKEVLLTTNVGESFFFGTFEQDNKTQNGAESIEWIVLGKEEKKVFVISKYGLIYKKFGNKSWQNSTLRSWLNGEFLNSAFTSEEQSLIMNTRFADEDFYDKVFLLNRSSFYKYLPTNLRNCTITQYAIREYGSGEHSTAHFTYHDWWIIENNGERNYVNLLGSIQNGAKDYSYVVRPAMWLDLG